MGRCHECRGEYDHAMTCSYSGVDADELVRGLREEIATLEDDLAAAKKSAAEWEKVAMDHVEESVAGDLIRARYRRDVAAWCFREEDASQRRSDYWAQAVYRHMAEAVGTVELAAARGDLAPYYARVDAMTKGEQPAPPARPADAPLPQLPRGLYVHHVSTQHREDFSREYEVRFRLFERDAANGNAIRWLDALVYNAQGLPRTRP